MEMTVVFADLSSFTEMTGRLGQRPPTRWLMSSCAGFGHTCKPRSLHRQIHRRCGDGLIQRSYKTCRPCGGCGRGGCKAPRASSRTFRPSGPALHASIGIASGFARVGRLGSDDIKDYTAIGDVVNQAARLQAQAGPTEILVSQDVYREIASAYPASPCRDARPEGLSATHRGLSLERQAAFCAPGCLVDA